MRAAPSLLLLIAACLFDMAAAHSQEIGLVAPLSDRFAMLGGQMRDGAETAVAALGLPDYTLDIEDDACTAEGGAEAARAVAESGARIVVGFLCTEAIEAAMPILADAEVPVITPGVRTASLTDDKQHTGWPVFRTAPRADDEQAAVDRLLVQRWRDEYFAIVDDGTIYGRELAESFRLAAEEAGLKPVFVDTYRPQMENQIGLVGRLSRAGATHVFIGGDRDDVAIIARDAAAQGDDLVIAGGEALRAAPGMVPLKTGTLMIGLPEPAKIARPEALRQFSQRDIVPEGYALPTYSAVEIAEQALASADETGKSLSETLSAGTFETATGKVSFDAKGDLSENPYRLFRYDGKEFVEVEDQK